jgi:hypothetical protein
LRIFYNCCKSVLAVLVLVGCASGADSIAPLSIPSSNYTDMSCDETKTALSQAQARETALSESQNNAATGDAIGVFLVLLPLGSVFGDKVEGKLAQAKGEVLALQGAVRTNCRDKRSADNAPQKSGESVSVRLEKVQQLLKDGLITQKEADEKRSAILDSM